MALPFLSTPVFLTPRGGGYRTRRVPARFMCICACACACPSLRGGEGALLAVSAATSAVISRICAACTARISAISPVVVLVVAEAAFRVLTVLTSSPPPDFSSHSPPRGRRRTLKWHCIMPWSLFPVLKWERGLLLSRASPRPTSILRTLLPWSRLAWF